MSEVLIDVAWRGLEVGRQVLLREVTGEHGRIDVPLPMPVGTQVTVRTAEGLEIPAIVTAVHEQSSIGGERPGMVVVPSLADAARGWWSDRAAEYAASVPLSASSSADDEPVVIVSAAPPGARTSSPAIAIPPEPAPTSSPAIAIPPEPAPVAPVAPTAPRRAATTDGTSAVAQLPTAALSADDLRAARAAAIADAAADLADAVAASPRLDPVVLKDDGRRTEQMTAFIPPEATPEVVADDTSQTAIMSAVDVDAIVADGVANRVDEDGPGETSGSHDTATGKRKPTPRGKKRKAKP